MSAPVLTGAAAAVDRLVTDAVDAAGRRDADALLAALARLRTADPGHVRRLLGAAVRPLLEDLHPDGVDGDDLVALIQELLSTTAFLDAVDPPRVGGSTAAAPAVGSVRIDEVGLAVVLTGAFGIDIAPREELPRALTDEQVAEHAVVLLGHLAGRTRRLRPYLDLAWAEVAREDLQD